MDQGLRGISALGVVASHTVLSFWRDIVPPSVDKEGHLVGLMQRPILRLVAQGNAWLAVFFILLGYVNSLKCIAQSRAGKTDTALHILASNSFRRTGRLVFPAAAVTVLAWLACQLGAFDLARESDAYWLRTTAPRSSSTWLGAVGDLLAGLVDTWLRSSNPYDQPQWALLPLLKGSMLVFMVLLITVRTTPRFRLLVEVFLYTWSWLRGDFLVGTNIFAGMILAELVSDDLPSRHNLLTTLLPFPLAFAGLFLMSFPNEYYEQTTWSRILAQAGRLIFPLSSEMGRAWPGLGAQILCFSVCFSPLMRQAMSHKYLIWLGGIAYSLYLLHGPLMRSILAWMAFTPAVMIWGSNQGILGGQLAGQSLIPLPRPLAFAIILPLFWAFLLFVVHLWSSKVEPKFGTATKLVEDLALGKRSEVGVIPTLPTHRVELVKR